MKPPTPDEVTDLLLIRDALELDEWPSDRIRERVLERLRVIQDRIVAQRTRDRAKANMRRLRSKRSGA